MPPNCGPSNGYSPATAGNTPLAAAAPVDSEQSHVRIQGLHTHNEYTGQTIHIGPSSVPALVMALGRGDTQWPGIQDLMGKNSTLKLFALDNVLTPLYPDYLSRSFGEGHEIRLSYFLVASNKLTFLTRSRPLTPSLTSGDCHMDLLPAPTSWPTPCRVMQSA